jgi:hypothetical protein
VNNFIHPRCVFVKKILLATGLNKKTGFAMANDKQGKTGKKKGWYSIGIMGIR